MSSEGIHWIGIDTSKKTFDAALLKPGQRFPQTPLRAVPVETFERTGEGVTRFLEWLSGFLRNEKAPAMRAVMEATGPYSVELCAWLCEQCPALAPAIANPAQTEAFSKSLAVRNKTDRMDARVLAFFGAERQPAAYEPLTPAHQQLRELSRYRDALVAEKVAESNRAEQQPQSNVVRKLQKRREAQRVRDIKRVEEEMKRLIMETPHLKKDFDLLVTIPGVGFVTAAVVLAEIGDLRRFARARQATAFVGLSPRKRESGTSLKGQTRMCKRGNSRVRQALYLAAMAATRPSNPIGTTYRDLIRKGKKPMAALGAIMRKLFTIMRAIVITSTPYEPCGKPCGKHMEILA